MQTSHFVGHGGGSTMHLPFYFFLFFLLIPLITQAQESKNTCGVYHKPSNGLTANQSVDVVDQFGNGYTFEELNIRSLRDQYASNGESRNASNCTGGDFTLEFINFTCDEEITICNVFQEISNVVDIGPNGSSPLITIIKEPFQNNDGTNNTGILGTGSPLFVPECGLTNNLVFDVMYSDVTLAAGTAAGILRINSLVPLYNDVQGPIAGHFDLHTVALHEMLHILGYSSLITNGGGSVAGYYSPWDRHLYSDLVQDSLLAFTATAPIGCCNSSEFNPALDYNQVMTADCNMDIFFRDDNGLNIARVYGAGNPASSPGGLLSHLDRCGEPGDQFVMTSSLGPVDERDLTQEEIDIILALGYRADGDTAKCNVIANIDFIQITNPSFGSFIPYEDIFGNDAVPDDFDPQADVDYHLSDCGTAGDVGGLQIVPTASHLLLIFSPCLSFDLCYTIHGCEGECDDGVIRINKICPPCYDDLPDCAPADVCAGDNLFCYGDFDQFIPNVSSGEPSLQLDVPFCSAFAGTIDVLYNQISGNRVLGYYDGEGIIIPLSSPVQPGCTINFSGIASGSQSGTLQVYGSSMSPCESNETPACPSTIQSDFQCIGTNPIVNGGVNTDPNGIGMFPDGYIPCDGTTPPDIDCTCTDEIPFYNDPSAWSNITLAPFVNNSNEAINFLFIRTERDNPNMPSMYTLFDDLVVTANCDNELTITADTPVDVCRGDEGIASVLVCIEGTNTIPNDAIITANFPNLLGINITAGSAFDGGSHTIFGTTAGPVGNANCYFVDFNLEVDFNVPIGTQIEVDFDIVLADACSDPLSITSTLFNVISCDIPCVLQDYPTITASCGNDGAIDVIVAGGSGNYTYQWSGGLGNGPSVSGLAPGNYEFVATDVSDPDCFIKAEYEVLVETDCGTGCVGERNITIEHKVVQILCLDPIPGFDRYYIDMYIPNWGGTQTEVFELCSEDIFVTTPGVILESNESFIIQSFSALNIFMIIQVPTGTPIDQGICFETPVCVDAEQVCAEFCVTEFVSCEEEVCDFEIVPDISLTPTGMSCGNLTGDDLFLGNVGIEIQGVSGVNLDYVQFVLVTGNGDPTFWQETNVPQTGGVATLADQAMCWKAYDSQYFCFRVVIGYSIGDSRFECERNICLNVDDLLGTGEGEGGGDDERGERRNLDFQKGQDIQSVFRVFPNPVGQQLNVQNTQQAAVQLELITIQGSVLSQQSLAGYDQAKIGVGNYPPGVYLLRIRDAASGAILQMEKVIVAH